MRLAAGGAFAEHAPMSDVPCRSAATAFAVFPAQPAAPSHFASGMLNCRTKGEAERSWFRRTRACSPRNAFRCVDSQMPEGTWVRLVIHLAKMDHETLVPSVRSTHIHGCASTTRGSPSSQAGNSSQKADQRYAATNVCHPPSVFKERAPTHRVHCQLATKPSDEPRVFRHETRFGPA